MTGDDKLATVDPISDKCRWSARAAAADALQRVGHDMPFLAIWLDADGFIKYSKANTDGRALSVFASIILEFAQSCYRKDL